MADRTPKVSAHRAPLSQERIVSAAIAIADEGGLDALTMRRLGEAFGVEAMAIYYHFANKDAVLDEAIERVFGEIEQPSREIDWKTAMRRRALSVRDVLLRHRWAIGLMESRSKGGPAILGHHDAVLGCLRSAGFGVEQAGHAYALMDSYIYGFAQTQLALPFDSPSNAGALGRNMLAPFPASEFPNFAEMLEYASRPGYAYSDEFEFGLDLILDALERIREVT